MTKQETVEKKHSSHSSSHSQHSNESVAVEPEIKMNNEPQTQNQIYQPVINQPIIKNEDWNDRFKHKDDNAETCLLIIGAIVVILFVIIIIKLILDYIFGLVMEGVNDVLNFFRSIKNFFF